MVHHGAIYTSKKFQAEPGLTTDLCVYVWPSLDGSESRSVRLKTRAEHGSVSSVDRLLSGTRRFGPEVYQIG